MSIKLNHLQVLWGLAGAREKFEDMVSNVAGITSRGLCGIGEQAIVPGTEMIVA